MAEYLATLDASLAAKLPPHCSTLFTAKTAQNLSFSTIATHLHRSPVAVAAIFYGQAPLSPSDIPTLADLLKIPAHSLKAMVPAYPTRGCVEMPPREPLVYRLWEVVQTYGWAFKGVLNEKFGDGIMSAVAFSTDVEKEVDEGGQEWVVIKMRGKWLPYNKF